MYPAVIVLHTAGGLQGHILEFSSQLRKHGYVVEAVPYHFGEEGTRGQGKRRDIIEKELPRIAKAYDRLKKHQSVDPNRIGMVGFSRGSARAIEFVARYPDRPVQAIVSYYVGCFTCQVVSLTPGKFFPPMLFLHGELDEDTHPWEIEEWCKYLVEVKGHSDSVCEIIIYPGVHHAFDKESRHYPGGLDEGTTADAFQRAVAFLNKYVKGRSK